MTSLPSHLAPTGIDLSECENEPIHIAGAIQPHGCLLVCSLTDWTVTHASANVAEVLGLAPATVVLGGPAETIVSERVLHDLRNTLQGSMISGSAERLVNVTLSEGGAAFDLTVHASGTAALIEFTPHGGADTTTTDPVVLIKSMVGRLKRAPTLSRYLQMAASQIRSVTGYDRVMIYRFFADGSGQVVAEALRQGLQPFMGLHYPASDIPSQARQLYLKQWLRMIVDVDYRPVPLLRADDQPDTPVDLGLASLRSVSPVHLEYLRNMGSSATLTVSLILGDRLWGLIACHHEEPRRLSVSTCAAAELFGQIFSLQIESKQTAEDLVNLEALRGAHDRLIAAMPPEQSLFDNLPAFAPMLTEIVPCDGLGVWVDGRFSGVGMVPPLSAMPALVAMLEAGDGHETFVTSTLSHDLPLASSFAERVSGLVAIRFSRATRDYLLFFRREIVQTIVWGGNPNKPVDVGGAGTRIGPRKSFEAWREQVRGASAPWLPAEVQIVRTLRVSLLDVVLRRSDLINKERRSSQERQSLLIAELNHRVKNVLALIRSLVRQSRQHAHSVESFTADLEQRIRALAFAHDQLTQVGWRGAPLRRLLDAEVEAWAGSAVNRVRLVGDPVILGSRGYQSLALVFHEMMTNAAKYGALSTPQGRLTVEWSLDENGDLGIAWTESGGPVVVPPTRRGFGTVIVEQTIPFELQGESHVDYRPTGLTGRFVVPAGHLVDGQGEPADDPASVAETSAGQVSLAGKRLLLVEDSMMIALDAQAMLADAGLEVEIVGTVADATRALTINTFDVAVLDVNLSGETSFPVADALLSGRIPFVFATGYGESSVIPERFASVAVVAKPYDDRSLNRALASGMGAGTARGPGA